MKKKLRFIINPFSGIGQKKVVPQLLDEILDKELYTWDVVHTEHPRHAIEISQDAVDNTYDAVIAVGGDGSINEIARPLIHSNTAMGIIPSGSGNGVARSLEIPLNLKEAILRISKFNVTTIDTGLLNGHPFIGVAGIGFDALISHEFANRKLRGKFSYGLVILKKMNSFVPMHVVIDGAIRHETSKAVVLAFANTSQYGNNAYIAPTADPKDGRLKLSIIEKFNTIEFVDITQKIFRKKILDSQKVTSIEFEKIVVTHDSKYAHIDGEPIEVPKEITVQVVPLSLKIIV